MEKKRNLWVIPTDKPSRLIINWEKDLCYKSKPYLMEGTQNIYITSDEEIKEGDWYYLPRTNSVYRCNESPKEVNLERSYGVVKIILTDNKDLIKDGVQAIDDEFLEWFIKNPSCEEVEVIPPIFSQKYAELINYSCPKGYLDYKIIISKEEPKKKHIVMIVGDKVNEEQTKCYCGHTSYCDCGPEEPKQETLEEATQRICICERDITLFELGAKWQQEHYHQFTLAMDDLKSSREGYLKAKKEYELKQQERSYSEEEVLNKLTHFAVEIQRQNKEGVFPLRIKEWFERNKKK